MITTTITNSSTVNQCTHRHTYKSITQFYYCFFFSPHNLSTHKHNYYYLPLTATYIYMTSNMASWRTVSIARFCPSFLSPIKAFVRICEIFQRISKSPYLKLSYLYKRKRVVFFFFFFFTISVKRFSSNLELPSRNTFTNISKAAKIVNPAMSQWTCLLEISV